MAAHTLRSFMRALAWCSLGGASLVTWSCAGTATARGEVTSGAGDTAANGCSVVRNNRLYVALSEGMTLDDFELAAAQAEQMLSFLQHRLCAIAPSVDPSGALGAALAKSPLEMVELHFTRDDGAAADITLHDLGADAAASHGTFHVLVTQREETMQAVALAAP